MARSHSRAARSARSSIAAGLSITELLIYVLLGGVLAATAASLVISNIRTSRAFELRQRAVDFYGRITHLLQLEISEGDAISYNQPLPAGCGPGTSLFTVSVPFPNDSSQETEIAYYSRNNGNDLWRCGPRVGSNGSLFNSSNQPRPVFDALVNANTLLQLTNTSDPRAVNYRLTLRDSAGQTVYSAGTEALPLIARTGIQNIE